MVRAAEAEMSLARSELQLYTVTASINGEIAWLDVSPGTVSWPGAMIWGEIMDLSELDVRCEVSPVQVEQVALGQSAEVWLAGKTEAAAIGKVVLIGKAADRNSGLIPVIVRVANPQQRLRAEIAVKVRFQAEAAK
jgi:multidrug efflux pump subunit AcrA (membrane-fusion protein)